MFNFCLGAKHVKIVSLGWRRTNYVEVNVKTNFTVVPATHEAIPSETTYRWHLVRVSDGKAIEGSTSVFSYSYPRYGPYDLSVIGNHSTGSFSAQIRIEAESKSESLPLSLSLSHLFSGPVCV